MMNLSDARSTRRGYRGGGDIYFERRDNITPEEVVGYLRQLVSSNRVLAFIPVENPNTVQFIPNDQWIDGMGEVLSPAVADSYLVSVPLEVLIPRLDTLSF